MYYVKEGTRRSEECTKSTREPTDQRSVQRSQTREAYTAASYNTNVGEKAERRCFAMMAATLAHRMGKCYWNHVLMRCANSDNSIIRVSDDIQPGDDGI
jgi:hypothetical protein